MAVAAQPERARVARPDAIGLDLDGTLVDSAPDIAWSANLTLLELGFPALAEQEVRQMIGDGIDTLLQRCLEASLGRAADESELARARPVLLSHYRDNIFNRGAVYPGVETAIRRWHSAGISLACITNKASALTAPLLRACGLGEFIDAVFCADRRADRKPAPNLLLQCQVELAIEPSRFLMIGDSNHDLLAARAAGSPAVAVSYGYCTIARLEAAAPQCIIDRMDNLYFY